MAHMPPQQPYQPPPAGHTVTVNKGANHVLHLIITILTCGLWIPGWIIAAVIGRKQTTTVVPQQAYAQQQQLPPGGYPQAGYVPPQPGYEQPPVGAYGPPEPPAPGYGYPPQEPGYGDQQYPPPTSPPS